MNRTPRSIRTARKFGLRRGLLATSIATLAASLLLASSDRGLAASASWIAAPTNGNWEPAALETNWSTGAGNFPGATSGAGSTDVATFNVVSTITSIVINNPPPNLLNIGGITFTGSASNYTVGSAGGQGIFLSDGAVIQADGALTGAKIETVNAPLTIFGGGSATFRNNSDSGTLHFGGGIIGNTAFGSVTLFLDGSNTNANTISGLIGDGPGPGTLGITKNGTGTWVLTNNGNTYTGGTTINNGTFVVGDQYVLGDFGPNNNVTLNGGTLMTPLDAPLAGPYQVYHDFNANGGTLFVQVGSGITGDPFKTDEMLANDASLDPNNSHLFVHRTNGYNPNNGDYITIISTNNGVFGQFSDAPPDAPAPNDFLGLIQPFAVYTTDTVDLEFKFAALFVSVARTPNQFATAAALDKAVDSNCIPTATNYLGNISIFDLPHAYDLIAPEELASIYETSFSQGVIQSLNLERRMDDIRAGSMGFCAEGFAIHDNNPGMSKNEGKSVTDKSVVEQQAPPNDRWGVFITGTGEVTNVGHEGDPGTAGPKNAAGYQLTTAGFTMGVDYRVTDHFAIGLSGGYVNSKSDLVNGGRLDVNGGKLGLYATYFTGGFYVDAAGSGGWNNYDTRRSALSATTSSGMAPEYGSTDGSEFNGLIAAGFDWKRGCWLIGPTASFEYSYVQFNSFTEGDTSLIPLHFPDQNQDALRSNLGFRIAHEQLMKPGEGLTVIPELRASWRHDYGDTSYAIDSNFVGCTDVFTVHGPYVGRDSAVVSVGLTALCNQNVAAYIYFDGQFGRDNYTNGGVSGGLRVSF
jgi:outer membrane autotransporter protein